MPNQPKLKRDWLVEFRDNLLHSVLQFWMEHGIDCQHGGAMGWLDRCGKPIPPNTKSVAQQGRLLWALAQTYRRYPEPIYAEAAAHVLRFLRDKMWDPRRGGYYWLVSREGHVLDGMKLLNPMAFVLEGLAVYALALHDRRALDEAMDLFAILDSRAHDREYGGYHMVFTPDWQPLHDYTPGPRVSETAGVAPVDEVHPVLADAHGRKSSDWHLGLLEAFATLYDVTGEATVGRRLEELVDLFAQRMVNTEAGYVWLYFTADWKPSDRNGDSLRGLYGLDMETSWLMSEAARLVGKAQDARVRAASLALVDHALAHGFDSERGGLYLEGPAAGGADRQRKEWWQQAEALVGLLNAHQITGCLKYWQAFEQQARFVLADFVDHDHGDWYAAIDADGTVDATKAGPWRGPYHATRACLEMIARLGGTL